MAQRSKGESAVAGAAYRSADIDRGRDQDRGLEPSNDGMGL